MQLLFVYGSLKQGFANEHVNTGRRVAGRFRTRERFVLCLHGAGEVPCLLAPAGQGHQVVGELYEVTADDLVRMDRLERVGDADGYARVDLLVERLDGAGAAVLAAQAYMKDADQVAASDRRTEPLVEYLPEHALRFHWVGHKEPADDPRADGTAAIERFAPGRR